MQKNRKEKVKNKSSDIANINVVSGYCAKCLKEINENDKGVTRDHDGNWFCCWECKQDFIRELKRECDCRLQEWKNWDR